MRKGQSFDCPFPGGEWVREPTAASGGGRKADEGKTTSRQEGIYAVAPVGLARTHSAFSLSHPVSLAGQARLISLREIPLCRYAYHSIATRTSSRFCLRQNHSGAALPGPLVTFGTKVT